MPNYHPPVLPADRPPPRILAVRCDQLDQLWFMTNYQRSMAIASLISRIVPVEFDTQLQLVETGMPRIYMPPSPIIIDRRPPHDYARSRPYDGPMQFNTINAYEGRGQQFTPDEKRKTFIRLKTHIAHQYWLLLGPVGQLTSMPRYELPPHRAFKKLMKEQMG